MVANPTGAAKPVRRRTVANRILGGQWRRSPDQGWDIRERERRGLDTAPGHHDSDPGTLRRGDQSRLGIASILQLLHRCIEDWKHGRAHHGQPHGQDEREVCVAGEAVFERCEPLPGVKGQNHTGDADHQERAQDDRPEQSDPQVRRPALASKAHDLPQGNPFDSAAPAKQEQADEIDRG